jgi:hypothetical protein
MNPSAAQQERMRQLVQKTIADEQQRLSIQLQMLKLTEKCWDACVTEPGATRLSERDTTCIKNCVFRYFDAQVFMRDRMFGKMPA